MKVSYLRRSIFSIGLFWIVLQMISCSVHTDEIVHGYVNQMEVDGKTIYQIFKHRQICEDTMNGTSCDNSEFKVNLAYEKDSIVCDPSNVINVEQLKTNDPYEYGKIFEQNGFYFIQNVFGDLDFEVIELKENIFSRKRFSLQELIPSGSLRDFNIDLNDSSKVVFKVGIKDGDSYFEEHFDLDLETWSFKNGTRVEKRYLRGVPSLGWEFTNRFQKCF